MMGNLEPWLFAVSHLAPSVPYVHLFMLLCAYIYTLEQNMRMAIPRVA